VLTNLEQAHYYLIAQLSPFYMLVFTIVGICVPIYYMSRRVANTEVVNPSKSDKTNRVWFVLGLTVLLSVVVALYPYLPRINPGQLNPSVDINDYIVDYYRLATDPSQIFTMMSGSRPLYYLLLLAFQKMTSLDPLNAVRFLPVP